MIDKPVFFIAFQEQDNLGIGYIASVLLSEGYKIKIIDFCVGKETVLEQIEHYDPLIVGFSIIFQYHIEDFKKLIQPARFFCKNCGRSAVSQDNLCNPEKLN